VLTDCLSLRSILKESVSRKELVNVFLPNDIAKNRKENWLKTKEINLLIRKKSHLSIENKLLIYKAVIKSIWSYGIELLGCASKSIIVIMQRSQSKILRAIANSPSYVTNHTLHTDFNIPYVNDVIHESINKNYNNLEAQPNPLLEPLLQTINTRRLKRCRLTRHLKWHPWMNSLPRHSNTWYRSVLCIIITLAYKLYSFRLLIKIYEKNH